MRSVSSMRHGREDFYLIEAVLRLNEPLPFNVRWDFLFVSIYAGWFLKCFCSPSHGIRWDDCKKTNAAEKVVVVTSRNNHGGFTRFYWAVEKGSYQGETRSKIQVLTPVQLLLESAEFVDDMGEKIEVKHAKASMGITREKLSLTTLTAVSVVLGNTMRSIFTIWKKNRKRLFVTADWVFQQGEGKRQKPQPDRCQSKKWKLKSVRDFRLCLPTSIRAAWRR